MTDFVVKIDDMAFDKLIFMRDHKPFEVTMFGISKADNLLHIEDFRLVKQEVESASSDCDPEGMAEYVCKMLALGVGPLRSERFWAHTHPMKGEGSANPSGKDMATWNDEDNSLKQFMVMFILSASGHMTCKVRWRGDTNLNTPGLNMSLVKEFDPKIEIVKTEDKKTKVSEAIKNIYGQQCIDALGEVKAIELLGNQIPILKLYPEFEDLIKEYDLLVSKKVYHNTTTTTNNNRNIGFQHQDHEYRGHHYSYQSQKKRNAEKRHIPEILLMANEHAETLDDVKDMDLVYIKSSFDVEKEEIAILLKDFNKDRPTEPNMANVFLACISNDLISYNHKEKNITFSNKNGSAEKRGRALNDTSLLYPEFNKALRTLNEMENSK